MQQRNGQAHRKRVPAAPHGKRQSGEPVALPMGYAVYYAETKESTPCLQ